MSMAIILKLPRTTIILIWIGVVIIGTTHIITVLITLQTIIGIAVFMAGMAIMVGR